MRRLLASLSTIALLSPIAASAAAYATPDALFEALSAMKGLTRSTAEVHLHADDVYVSAWLSGKQEGAMTDPEAKGRWKATIDVVQGAMKIRAKIQAHLYQQVLYVKIDSLDGSLTGLLGSSSWSVFQKQWIKIPIDETMTGELETAGLINDTSVRNMLNALFAFEQKRFKGGYAYTLTPSEALRAQMDLPTGANIDLTIKADTDLAGAVLYVKVAGDIRDPDGNMTLTFHADTQPTNERVNVEVPKDALTLEELGGNLNSLQWNGGHFGDFSLPSMDFDTPTNNDKSWQSDWTEIWDGTDVAPPTWIDGCTTQPGTPARVLEIRRGLCNPHGVGRGQVQRSR